MLSRGGRRIDGVKKGWDKQAEKHSASSWEVARRLVTATTDLSRRNHAEAINLPGVMVAESLRSGRSSQCHVSAGWFLIRSCITLPEVSQGDGGGEILFGKLQFGNARSVSGREGEQRAALALAPALLPYPWWTENSSLNVRVNSTWSWQIGGVGQDKQCGIKCVWGLFMGEGSWLWIVLMTILAWHRWDVVSPQGVIYCSF